MDELTNRLVGTDEHPQEQVGGLCGVAEPALLSALLGGSLTSTKDLSQFPAKGPRKTAVPKKGCLRFFEISCSPRLSVVLRPGVIHSSSLFEYPPFFFPLFACCLGSLFVFCVMHHSLELCG